MQKPLKIGNAQGFWGDSPEAPARLLKQQPDLDYLTLDYLAEISLSIMAVQREKDPEAGYARDFLDVIRSLIPFWKEGSKVKIVTNAGGLNPKGCAQACAKILQEASLPLRVGVVSGDDVLEIIKSNPNEALCNNLDNNTPMRDMQGTLATANAYIGAKPIAEAVQMGADIIITGRVTDPSLTVGPCAAYYNWHWNDYDKLAGATIAGHLIECGTQATGGIWTHWLELCDPVNIGFPVVEVNQDGSCVLTKPPQTGGAVNLQVVKEQLLYEIGDPDNYLSPDVTVSFLSLQLEQIAQDRVLIKGAKGKAPPSTLKVSATYRDGYKAEGILALYGNQVCEKAASCGEIILKKVKLAGYDLERTCIESIGCGDLVPGITHGRKCAVPMECMLRVCVADKKYEAVECFVKEIASMVTSGPQGVTGYTSGRPHIRPIYAFWPCRIEPSKVNPKVEIIEVKS